MRYGEPLHRPPPSVGPRSRGEISTIQTAGFDLRRRQRNRPATRLGPPRNRPNAPCPLTGARRNGTVDSAAKARPSQNLDGQPGRLYHPTMPDGSQYPISWHDALNMDMSNEVDLEPPRVPPPVEGLGDRVSSRTATRM